MRKLFIVGGAGLIAIVIGVFLFFCGGGFSYPSSSAAIENYPAAVAVQFTELMHGAQSDVAMRTNYLITSASELNKLWKMIGANGKIPVIDFTKNSVAAIFAGKEPTTGYSIAVSKVEDTDVRTVTVTLVKPGSSCAKGRSVTAPYALIEIPKTSLVFTHEDQVRTTNCQ